MDIVTYKLSQKYADKVAAGFSSVRVDGLDIIFTLNNGETVTVTIPTPEDGHDGVSITDVSLNQQSHLICTLSDGTTVDAGLVHQGVDGQDGYTPVKGVDYWTDQDKVEIVQSAVTQVNVLENLTLEGTVLTKNNKTIEIKDPEVTNARLSTTKGKNFESVDARIEELEMDVNDIKTTIGYVYGVRRKITNNSSPSWERILDSVGRFANATKDGGNVQNDFDSLAPWSEIKSCNYDLTTKEIKAWFGDPNFKFDGTNGDVFTYIPKTYWKIYQEDDYEYVLLSDTPQSNFIEIDDFFIGRYDCTDIRGVLHSYSGLIPTTSRNITQFRNLAQDLGQKFSQLDWRYFVIQMIYLVEYATYDCQSVLGNGIMSRNVVNTLIAESSTNRVVIADATNFYVGQIIRVGTAANGAQIIMDRKITAIAAYDDGSVTGYALTFSGASANIAVGNYVSTCVQQTGQCDSLGMKSGCLNDDGYHSVIYRGMENIYSDVYQFIDGINISNSQVYFCKDHSQYQTNYYEAPYNLLPYVMYSVSNGWIKTLGFAETEPILRLPTDIGGSSSTYMCDYYVTTTGSVNLRVGGCSSDGQKNGFWALMTGAPAGASWDRGARVLIDGE